ncbi:MAG: nuclear transport factor 2 family protein [Deltaproteobacteria bacterium]|nr:nuclear transport factor 2 family protein [Deltaproteobacteria bacterium]
MPEMLTRDEAVLLFDRRRRAWLDGDLDAYLALFAENLVFLSPVHAEPLRGRAAFAELVRGSFARMQPLSFDFREIAVQGDAVLAEWRIETELRDGGRRIAWDGMSICRIENGEIQYWREYWNPGDLK